LPSNAVGKIPDAGEILVTANDWGQEELRGMGILVLKQLACLGLVVCGKCLFYSRFSGGNRSAGAIVLPV